MLAILQDVMKRPLELSPGGPDSVTEGVRGGTQALAQLLGVLAVLIAVKRGDEVFGRCPQPGLALLLSFLEVGINLAA